MMEMPKYNDLNSIVEISNMKSDEINRLLLNMSTMANLDRHTLGLINNHPAGV
ncbi:MAG: hypothetical protein WCF23_00155 [Candidatus Nitrosopolaris sp.]